jgi:hypothetical protein
MTLDIATLNAGYHFDTDSARAFADSGFHFDPYSGFHFDTDSAYAFADFVDQSFSLTTSQIEQDAGTVRHDDPAPTNGSTKLGMEDAGSIDGIVAKFKAFNVLAKTHGGSKKKAQGFHSGDCDVYPRFTVHRCPTMNGTVTYERLKKTGVVDFDVYIKKWNKLVRLAEKIENASHRSDHPILHTAKCTINDAVERVFLIREDWEKTKDSKILFNFIHVMLAEHDNLRNFD